jgi:phosphate starvation-inducible protein PhoH and related proteins
MVKKKKLNGSNGNDQNNNEEYKLLREFKPKTRNQSSYVRAIVESEVILCTGPAGTGKTAVAVGLACEHLVHGKIQKIVITRPVVEAGRGIGYLPGTANEKLHPYLLPILDEMSMYFDDFELQKLMHQNIIEIAPLEYMRGRNFHRSFMILDEGQNATYDQLKMFVTRIGNHSKCILNGDLSQSDLNGDGGGLQEFVTKLVDIDGVSILELTHEDIIRNPIISKILTKLET